MPRLLMVTTVPITLRSFLFPFANHFRSQGWRVDALSNNVSTCSECVAAFDQVRDVVWTRRPITLSNLLWSPGMIKEITLQEKYDLVHVHTPTASWVTRYALRRLRRRGRPKVIYTVHGFHFYKGGGFARNALFVALEKLAGGWTDYLVTINHEDMNAARRFRLVPSQRVIYMPGIGVDTSIYAPETVSEVDIREARQEMGLTAADYLFLMVAEFIPRKRHRDALEALAYLKHPNIHIAFAGSGPLMGNMKSLASTLGVNDQAHFLGFRHDIPTLMRAAGATLLPSGQEGLPRSVMESMCLEVPVIGTNIRGTRDLLEEGGGILVEVGDVEALAQAMSRIMGHPEETQLMGKQGRKRMVNYDIRRIIALHEELYAKALGTHP